MFTRKFLNIEFGFFCILSLCCLFYALFNLQNVDHIFSISSNSSNSIISFYLVSFLATIYYYVGPWVVFVLIFFSLTYFKVLNERDNWYDLLYIFFLAIGLCGIFYFISPNLLGGSLNLAFKSEAASYIAISMILISIICSLAILLERKPIAIIKGFARLVMLGLRAIKTEFSILKNKMSEKIQKNRDSQKIQEETIIAKQKDIYSAPVYEEEPDEDTEDETEEVDTVETVELADDVEGDEESIQSIVEVSKPVIKKAKPVKSFTSVDLIKTLEPEGGAAEYIHPDDVYFNGIKDKLEEKLGEFKIDSKVIDVLKGPVVDTFELELGAGVRVTKVTTIQDDLTLALSGAPIRVVYPMKGRTTIGLEVPRNPRETILLDEVLSSPDFTNTKALLPICMGKDAFGDVFIVDLAKMPHMLVAGATGAGKSVFINTLLVSLLVKKNHKEMKLILIDPKQLELAQYSKLPHLCLPVVTEPTMASASLMWAVEEMERRYTLLKEMGVRNLEGFNAKVEKSTSDQMALVKHLYGDNAENGFELPYIVIIIDEFADLILSKQGKEIESSVCRLAAKARAAGIHIVLATQRPSVDVITGLIKNNFPTRVSFRVTSSMDSKTILTKIGAEKLLGMGDMLYKHGVEMNRVHSAYVGEEEVEVLCEKLESIPQNYSQEALEFIEQQQQSAQTEHLNQEVPGGGFGKDPLFDQAVDIVRESRGASASMLQRRLRVGYNRAANLIDQLEMEGVIGPANGSKPRDILASRD